MSKPSTKDDFVQFLAHGNAWEQEVINSAQRRARVAYVVAAVASVLAILCVFLVLALLPLRTVEPWVIEVDRSTGEVKQMVAVTNNAEVLRSLSENEMFSQSNAVRYVIARETYDKSDYDTRFELVGLFSAPTVFNEYKAQFEDGPDSIFRKLGDGRRKVVVKSVSFLNSSTIAVRYIREDRAELANEVKSSEFVAIVTFRYVQTPDELGQKWMNPVGFEVTSYRNDQTTL